MFFYFVSTLLATATIVYSQVLIAFVAIQFAIELLEVESGVALLLDFESDVDILSRVVGEVMTFTAETDWAETVGYIGDQAVTEFGPDVVVNEIGSVATNAVDATFSAAVRWDQTIYAFGRNIGLDFSTSLTTQVTLDGEEALFEADGALATNGVNIQVRTPGYTARYIPEDSGVTFEPPIP